MGSRVEARHGQGGPGGGMSYIPGAAALGVGAEAAAGVIAPVLDFLGFGGPPDPRNAMGKAKYGDMYEERARAHAQAAAKSGVVQMGRAPSKKQSKTQGMMSGFTSDPRGQSGMITGGVTSGDIMSGGGGTGYKYKSWVDQVAPVTTQQRHTGGDAGPGHFLTQYRGSNRGSGNYVEQVPRYSVAETRTSINKYDKANFRAFNPHSTKKYLSPGTEQMFQKESHLAGGARKVTRKFL